MNATALNAIRISSVRASDRKFFLSGMDDERRIPGPPGVTPLGPSSGSGPHWLFRLEQFAPSLEATISSAQGG